MDVEDFRRACTPVLVNVAEGFAIHSTILYSFALALPVLVGLRSSYAFNLCWCDSRTKWFRHSLQSVTTPLYESQLHILCRHAGHSLGRREQVLPPAEQWSPLSIEIRIAVPVLTTKGPRGNW